MGESISWKGPPNRVWQRLMGKAFRMAAESWVGWLLALQYALVLDRNPARLTRSVNFFSYFTILTNKTFLRHFFFLKKKIFSRHLPSPFSLA